MKTATDQLVELWDIMKQEGNCSHYVQEMCVQLELLGTETNTLTRLMIVKKLEETLNKIKL